MTCHDCVKDSGCVINIGSTAKKTKCDTCGETKYCFPYTDIKEVEK